jgi:CHASE1-domain containing sensor protein
VRRYLPLFLFLVVAAIGGIITYTVRHNELAAMEARFEVVASEAAGRIRDRVQQHVFLLQAMAAHYRASGGGVTRESFSRFLAGFDLEERYRGVQGIGYAAILGPDDSGRVSASLKADYGIDRGPWPDSGAAIRTAILILEPVDARNLEALGFDMYSEGRRRAAMNRALATGETSATAPVTLVQEITSEKQAGFLVYVPLRLNPEGAVRGFIYAPFRAGDLHRSAISGAYLPVEMETRDAEGPSAEPLFTSPGFNPADDHRFEVTREFEIGGRTWHLAMHDAPSFGATSTTPFAMITGLISLLLAAAMAAATQWQLKAVDGVRALVTLKEETLLEKDLMLQEMKHRIKNSLARISAIARQTAASSATIEDFTQSFSSRLQSMANAQDMLTRSHWQGADLRELVVTELEQVFGSGFGQISLEGEPVALNGKQTQALGLTFHELATNALKYGAGSDGGRLDIDWRKTGGRTPELRFNWRETGGAGPSGEVRTGFGTKLIDVSIKGELRGEITRDFAPDGLKVRITIPLDG